MDLRLLWIVLAALVGALLHGWLQGGVWKQTIITGIITAVVFASTYAFQSSTLTVLDILLSIIGGYGVNAGVTAIGQKAQVTSLKKENMTLKKQASLTQGK